MHQNKLSIALSLFLIIFLVSVSVAQEGEFTHGSRNKNLSARLKPMQIHLLKISNWRSTLIISPSGTVTLISAGIKKDGKRVMDYLEKLGFDEIGYRRNIC